MVEIIELNKASHTYNPNLPSVTQILKAGGLIDDTWFTEAGALRGQHVHAACDLYDQGRLDWAALDPQLAGYVASYAALREMHPCKGDEWIEVPMADPTGMYAGTSDRLLWHRPRAVWDIKSGKPMKWHRYQLAAYVNMLPDPFGWDRVGVYLQANGSLARLKPYPKEEYISDLGVFIAALTLHQAKTVNGL